MFFFCSFFCNGTGINVDQLSHRVFVDGQPVVKVSVGKAEPDMKEETWQKVEGTKTHSKLCTLDCIRMNKLVSTQEKVIRGPEFDKPQTPGTLGLYGNDRSAV